MIELFNFLSSSKATAYLKGLIISDSIITFDARSKTDFLTYNFTVTSQIKTPDQFFKFIEKLKKQNLSIELSYPILFSRKTNTIEIQYKIKMHQQNKKQVSLKK